MRRDAWEMRRGGVTVESFRWGDIVEGGSEVRGASGLITGLGEDGGKG